MSPQHLELSQGYAPGSFPDNLSFLRALCGCCLSVLEGAKSLENESLELGEESPVFWVEVGCSIKQDGQMGLLGASI